MYLVGNKMDDEADRKISAEEGRKMAEKYGIPFSETSAKEGTNVT
jgi:Ras-related protein Rab-8A